MHTVQLLRGIVDQQIRPGQRGSATASDRVPDPSMMAATGAQMLVKMTAAGTIISYGRYGRSRYGQDAYLQATQ